MTKRRKTFRICRCVQYAPDCMDCTAWTHLQRRARVGGVGQRGAVRQGLVQVLFGRTRTSGKASRQFGVRRKVNVRPAICSSNRCPSASTLQVHFSH